VGFEDVCNSAFDFVFFGKQARARNAKFMGTE